MDVSKFSSEWLNAEAISKTPENPTIAIIQDEGSEYEGKFGKQIVFSVEIDGTTFKYRPSKTSIRNIIKLHGADTMAWIGKTIKLIQMPTVIRGDVKAMIVVL